MAAIKNPIFNPTTVNRLLDNNVISFEEDLLLFKGTPPTIDFNFKHEIGTNNILTNFVYKQKIKTLTYNKNKLVSFKSDPMNLDVEVLFPKYSLNNELKQYWGETQTLGGEFTDVIDPEILKHFSKFFNKTNGSGNLFVSHLKYPSNTHISMYYPGLTDQISEGDMVWKFWL